MALSDSVHCRLSVPAWQHIEEGQRQGWAPDAELCEMLIEVICRVKSRLDRGLEFVRDDMPVHAQSWPNIPQMKISLAAT